MITPTRKLITVLVGLFIGEATIMALINTYQLPPFLEAIADASVLILIALPILYLQFARPMIQQYQAIEKANRTAEILLHASMQFATSMELDQVVEALFRQIQILVPFDFAAVYTLQSPNRLFLRAAWKEGQKMTMGPENMSGLNPDNFPALFRILEEQKSIDIPDTRLAVEWFCPRTGELTLDDPIQGGRKRHFVSPLGSDVVLFLYKGE